METQAVSRLIQTGLPDAEVRVTGDGAHFDAIIISPRFAGLTPIKRQRAVLDTVRPQIASGELHALSIKTFTPEEWDAREHLIAHDVPG